MSMSRKNIKLFPKCYCQEIDSPRKYQDSLKLQIHTLAQEIRDINNDIENKKKQYSLLSHRLTTRGSADESRKINNQFSNNNINVILNEFTTKVDSEEEDVEKIIEFMNPEMRTEYLEMIKEKIELQHKIKSEQLEIDEILVIKMKLEKEIELLSTKVLKFDEKKEMGENQADDENAYDKNKQDDLEIMVNKQKKEKNDRPTRVPQNSEQFETNLKEDQFALIITDNALIKEINERIAAFENKLDEIIETHNDLENFIRENREQINLNRFEDKAVQSLERIMVGTDFKIAQS